jgi:hypothetical protein
MDCLSAREALDALYRFKMTSRTLQKYSNDDLLPPNFDAGLVFLSDSAHQRRFNHTSAPFAR